MNNKYWLDKWEANDIAFHENKINEYLVSYLAELNLEKGDSIFVPLCGKTKDMIWLADQGFHVIGAELSLIACQDFFKELNVIPKITQYNKFEKYQYKNIELFCGDFFELTRLDFPVVKAVYDCKALIALPSELREKYIKQIVNCLGSKINILLLTRETTCNVSPPPFPVSKKEVEDLYNLYFNVELLKSLQITEIPERLVKKGYRNITECVYLISQKN